MKCQILFSRKNKKNISNLPSAESAHSVLSIKVTDLLKFAECPFGPMLNCYNFF